jgi:hypothetical protein
MNLGIIELGRYYRISSQVPVYEDNIRLNKKNIVIVESRNILSPVSKGFRERDRR